MAKTKYIIDLSQSEREMLNQIIDEKKESARTILRAKILLASDNAKEKKISVEEIARQLGTTHTTVQTTRMEYGTGGLEKAVYRKTHEVSRTKRKISDQVIEEILAVYGEEPPAGKKKWSLRLLCQVCVDRGIVEKISPVSMMKVIEVKDNGKNEVEG